MKTDWRKLAEMLAGVIPASRLHPAVQTWASERPVGESWAVAFSGGADSLLLLLLVWALWPEHRKRLLALHFNHRLRGAESDLDEAFCREVSLALEIGFESAIWTDHAEGVSEEAAREVRHGFYVKAMAGAGAQALWLGHQRDDVAETLLMRLTRGSGASGLAAPRPVHQRVGSPVYLRPLLNLEKKAIIEALLQVEAPWREDRTNVAGHYFRNRIRSEVLPRLAQISPADALQGAALTRERLEEDDDALNAWLIELWPLDSDDTVLELRRLEAKPKALWRRALHRWRLAAGQEFSRVAFEELLAAAQAGRDFRMSAGADDYAVIEAGWLRCAEKSSPAADFEEQILVPDVPITLASASRVELGFLELTDDLRAWIMAGRFPEQVTVFLDAAAVQSPVRVRPWHAGDRYRPLGAPGGAKLQDLFVNRKIPAGMRHHLPVIVSAGGDILWVPGLPPADQAKITSETRRVVRLTYTPGTFMINP